MRTFLHRTLFVLLALLATREDGLRAQWKIVAPNLTSRPFIDAAALYTKDGVVWVGCENSISFSIDTGKTWLTPPFHLTISDINFFNTTIGLIGAPGGVFLTSDGGKTWRNILQIQGLVAEVAFGTTDSVIYALLGSNGIDTLYSSTNMGVSWRSAGFGGFEGVTLTVGKDGTVYVLSWEPGTPGWLNSSTDSGQTWSSNIGSVDGDSYSIIADSCSTQRLYLAHEGVASSLDGLSHLFVSSDAGVSWQATFTDVVGIIAGTISSSSNVVYAGTMDGPGEDVTGVLRSLDLGQTWTSIGGPSVAYDTRDIVMMNDNTVFALDQDGNVWSTNNSGGYPVRAVTISPRTLFSSDTADCDSIRQSLAYAPLGCKTDSIIAEWVIGPDSLAYTAGYKTGDSLPVTFSPAHFGTDSASMVFQLSNGTFDTIALEGYSMGERSLNFTTANEATDTLGATVSVPITITGLNQTENVNLLLHYDSVLQYQGSFDAANNKLDIPGQQWAGRSELNIPNAQSGVIAGYARFTVFADSVAQPHVTFDSLDVLSATSPCEYSLPSAVTSIITPPSGCGTTILSEFLQDSTIPTFSIRPNPTMGDVELTSSVNLGDAEVEIYDVLGVKRANLTVTLSNDAPALFSLPDAAGIYYLRIKSIAGVRSMSVVVAK